MGTTETCVRRTTGKVFPEFRLPVLLIGAQLDWFGTDGVRGPPFTGSCRESNHALDFMVTKTSL